MNQPIRFGVLGCGRIVERGFVPGLQSLSGAAILQAIASERPGVAAERAKAWNCETAYDSYAELLADPAVQAVYIPARGDLHYRWAIASALAGKHVLCEKPLATTVEQAEEMASACDDAGVVLQEAFMWRHHPRSRKAWEIVRGGTLGELRFVNASFSFTLDPSDWRMQPKFGGGAMWDIGCYGVNAARYFSDEEPSEVHARAHYSPTGADLSMQIGLRFPSGVFANIDCSFEAPFRCHAELVGTRGRVVLPEAFLPGDDAKLLLYTSVERDAAPEVQSFPGVNQYGQEIADFCQAIALGRLSAPAEDGVANVRVLAEVLKSAKHGFWKR